MSLDRATIASGTTPARARKHVLGAFFPITKTLPGVVRHYVENGEYKIDPQTPLFSGQVLVYHGQESLLTTSIAEIYIAVDIEGVLRWKRVHAQQDAYDTNTGKPWDPLAQYYDPLAS